MTKRRANHEGSIYHRKDGLWCAQLSLDGKRLTKYCKSQRDCRDWIKSMVTRIDGGLSYEGTRITLEDFTRLWLKAKELSIRERTLFQYGQLTNNYIYPSLGKMRLQDVRTAHIRAMQLRYHEAGTGPRTLQMIRSLLYSVFKQAVREGILLRNPVEAVERPRVEQKEVFPLSEDQARQFLIAASGERNEALFYLAIMTGMRQGELLGLMWSDLDWDKGVIHVQRQLQRIERKGLFLTRPKTRSGKRKIKIGPGLLEHLSRHRARQLQESLAAGDTWEEQDLMFPNSLGKPLEPRRIFKEFKELLKKAGLPDIRFHDMRHTAISLLIDMGIPINAIQERAGHSKASVTTDIYGHAMSRAQDMAAERIEDLVAPIAVKLTQ